MEPTEQDCELDHESGPRFTATCHPASRRTGNPAHAEILHLAMSRVGSPVPEQPWQVRMQRSRQCVEQVCLLREAGPRSDPMRPLRLDQDVMVDGRPDGSALVRISGGAAFNPGSATLTKRGKDALKKIGDELKQSKGSVRIEGHTDCTPLTGKNKETYGTNQNL